MQYVWQHRLWMPSDMKTVDGHRIDVVDPGLLNKDAGPDFFNAKVCIDGNVWAGNIEVHVRASDWYRHGHDRDKAYDNVILHVVGQDDGRIYRPDGQEIPQLVMPCSPEFSKRYHAMVNNPTVELACAEEIKSLPSIYMRDWLTALAMERLQAKADRAASLVERFQGDWRSVIYVILARALGFSTNSDAFERLALSMPLRRLMKHSDSQVAVEGMLFGQAGFLDDASVDDGPNHYVGRMQEEYRFMSAKYGLERPRSLGWKMARMRPQNFPHRRIATLAAMIASGFRIGYDLFAVDSVEAARRLFDIELTGYWSRRFNFGPPASRTVKALSQSSVDTLIINVVAPILYAYGTAYAEEELQTRAMELLGALKAERNSIVELFVAAGIECPDAFTSQALIELRREYCMGRKCLYCRIGHRLLAAKVRP